MFLYTHFEVGQKIMSFEKKLNINFNLSLGNSFADKKFWGQNPVSGTR
jgi:hypothetical protein